MHLGSVKLLFSKKSGVWSNGTVVFDLLMESASCLKLSISNLIMVFLVSGSSQSRLLSFTSSLCLSVLAFMSRIFVSRKFQSFNSHNSDFKEENDSWKEFEKEVACLIFVSGVRISFNTVSLS